MSTRRLNDPSFKQGSLRGRSPLNCQVTRIAQVGCCFLESDAQSDATPLYTE